MNKEDREKFKAFREEAREEQEQLKAERLEQEREEKEKYPSASLRRKIRRLRWKQERQDRRQALKDRYKNAPWILRVFRLYLLKPLIALVIIGGLGYVTATVIVPQLGLELFQANKNNPVSQEEIDALSPVDEKGAKRIDAVAPVDKDDTWNICVYISGSNLEDMNENDLSYAVQAQIAESRAQQQGESSARAMNRLNSFTDELKKNDLDIPAYLYYPREPVKSSGGGGESSGETVAEDPGAASTDIGEMTAEAWSDNIRIIIQTGGATRWSHPMINPNRTQRFVYYKGEFQEVYDSPIQRVTDPKTLTSFLNFCKKEYPADRNMLILWNHGGASFGYGHDSIYGGMMSLKDIREGLEGAYKPDMKNPPFDVIGYDACLMSSIEVAHAMSGFASYYAVSEETEPGEGWNYTPWLKAMSEDPTMSPARVAREIADSYTNFYMTQNVNFGWLLSNAVTFSVLDAKKSEELYGAYCDLAKKQLKDATEDRGVLAEIGRCSDKSLHYVPSEYMHYNTIDLGNYVDNLTDSYPAESSRVKKLIGEAVMYHRENGSLSGSQGISVYVPGSVQDFDGLLMCLQYIYEISDDPSTKALYYYKIAGCLNEDMEKYLETLTDKKLPAINLKPFDEFAKAKPVMTDTGFEIPIGEQLQNMLQSYVVEAAFYDEDGGVTKNYGKDELARLDGEGNMDCEFDGTWICLDGVPLATEVVSSTDAGVEYRSRVLYNGKEAYLSFAWDRDAEEFTLNGVRGASEPELAGGILNSMVAPDPVNYLVNNRMVTEVKAGDYITPIYETVYDDPQANKKDDSKTGEGQQIKIKKGSEIKSEKLDGGTYVTAAVISDSRGDVYYSQVVSNKVSGGKVKDRKVEPGFVGRDY